MKIFLDSADLVEIKKYFDYKIIDGVTTNPSSVSAVKEDFADLIKKMQNIIPGDISVEVAGNSYEEMIEEGKKILNFGDNIVLKLPINFPGILACRYFSDAGRKVNMTLCFSINQALVVAKAGATYVSPFIGRLEDFGASGVDLIRDIRSVYDKYNFDTQILAASIRSVSHVEQVAMIGADAVTIPVPVISKLIDHKLTDIGLDKFNKDWAKSNKKINSTY